MRDRSNELNNQYSRNGSQQRLNASASSSSSSLDQHASFFELVQTIQQRIKDINKHVAQLKQLQRHAMQAVRESERQQLASQMDALTQRTNRLTKDVRTALQHLTQLMQPGRQDYQMMRSQQLDLARKFRDAVVVYHDTQMEIQSTEKQQMERQIRIVKPNATDAEIHDLVEQSASNPGAIFSQRILESTRREEARRILNDVEDRHQHVVQLAKSIVELQTMFEDMSTMIESQDDSVMRVAAQINDVEANTKAANVELSQAIKSARSARKKKWCLICFFFIVLLGVAGYLAFHFLSNKAITGSPAPAPTPAPAPAPK